VENLGSDPICYEIDLHPSGNRLRLRGSRTARSKTPSSRGPHFFVNTGIIIQLLAGAKIIEVKEKETAHKKYKNLETMNGVKRFSGRASFEQELRT